jgi:glutamate/tyrosine decarboxylase-like PLP-dependent enzyme
MNRLLESAAERALRYLERIDDRAVAPDAEATERLRELDEPLPQAPSDPEGVLELLDARCSPATMAMSGPRFFGFVIGGSLPVTLAANWLASAWDQSTALHRVTPATAQLEELALSWLLDLFGLPPESGGAFVTGATLGNLCALAAARHAVYTRIGWDIEGDGMVGAPPVTVVIGGEAHPSVFKSLGLLGLGRNRVVRVPVDGQGRMRADLLPDIAGPTIVCAQAGNVNTGAFDPFEEICARAHESGAWVHVDGAFGLWAAAAAPARAGLVRGVKEADSWATDAHKWLNVPYDSGLAFARDREALRSAMAVTAEYLPTETERRNPADYTPELSRRARGVEVWAALKALGREGVADLVERTCRHARRFAEGLADAGYEILNEVVLNQVLVSFGHATVTEKVITDIQRDGTCWCGGTVWQGRTAMRISVSSWATTEEDVHMSLEAMLRCAARHRKSPGTGAVEP